MYVVHVGGRETATRIADVALTILIEEGADAVNMRRVAKAAGITPMAIYRHFDNREALLRAVADASFEELAVAWARRAGCTDLRTRLFGLLDDFLDFALGKPNLYTFLLTDRREQVRRYPDDFRAGGSPTYGPVVEAVTDGMRAGLVRQDDPLEVAMTLTAPVQGLVQLYLGRRIGLTEDDFRALCRRTVERIFTGIMV